MNDLLEKLKGVEDLTEKYGDIVIPKAGMKAHIGKVIGVFWYDTNNGDLEYSKELKNHADFDKHESYLRPGMIRGRVAEDVGVSYILLYPSDFDVKRLSGDLVVDIYNKVYEESNVDIRYIVDEFGRDLIEKHIKE